MNINSLFSKRPAPLAYLHAIHAQANNTHAYIYAIRVQRVNNIIATLREVRKNVDRHHNEWFTKIEEMCNNVGTSPSIPRLCGCQHN